MRSLVVQIYSHLAALPTTTRHNSRCWKRHRFCQRIQTKPLPSGFQNIRCQAAPGVHEEAAAQLGLLNFPKKNDDHHAIGITSFSKGKNYLVSGATGFLAKAFVEKLLRTVPDVGKIYLLIRAKNMEEAKRRLYSDIMESDVFETLRQTYGEYYEAFMEGKLLPIIGNIGEDNLGIDCETIDEITDEIDIIINSAATTTLDERYDVALNINTQGPARLLNFAKRCKNLCLFLQFSTTYANGNREGNIAEKAFSNGQSITAEKILSRRSTVSVPVLDVGSEIELALKSVKTCSFEEITTKMKELGQERANLYGWKNCYTLTKAMGEMLINSDRGDFPVVIIRPSIIESDYREPYPGWIQGNKVLDPVISMYGKGQIPSFVFDPQVLIDVIPVDMVVNTAIAAMAKHGQAGKPQLNVYHAASSIANPLSLGQMFDISYDYFTNYPLRDSRGQEVKIQKMEAMSSIDAFSSHISEIISYQEMISNEKSHNMLDTKQKRKVERIVNVAKLYQPYFFYYGTFDNNNSQKLINEMSLEEKKMFDFDIRNVNWKDYFMNVHIPGIKKHVMKGRC